MLNYFYSAVPYFARLKRWRLLCRGRTYQLAVGGLESPCKLWFTRTGKKQVYYVDSFIGISRRFRCLGNMFRGRRAFLVALARCVKQVHVLTPSACVRVICSLFLGRGSILSGRHPGNCVTIIIIISRANSFQHYGWALASPSTSHGKSRSLWVMEQLIGVVSFLRSTYNSGRRSVACLLSSIGSGEVNPVLRLVVWLQYSLVLYQGVHARARF